MVEREKTYCIPGRTILDNLFFFISNSINMSITDELDVDFLFIDQENALDQVSHNFLFNV